MLIFLFLLLFFFHNINSNPTPHASTSSRIGPLTFSFGNKGHSEGGCERSLSKKTSYLQKFPTAQITNSIRVLFADYSSNLI